MFDSIPLLLRAFESSTAMSVVWSACMQYFISTQDTRVHAKWAVQHTFMYNYELILAIICCFMQQPLIHSDLKNQGNKIEVFLTEKWRQQNVVTYNTVGDMIRH